MTNSVHQDVKVLQPQVHAASPAIAAGTCLLRVSRPSGYPDRIRRYRIFVNDREVGTVAAKSVTEIYVPSGRLTLSARLDWGRSKPLIIDAVPNQRIDLEVSNTYGALLALYAVTFGAGSYLTVRQLP
jgi:hypothetical protein